MRKIRIDKETQLTKEVIKWIIEKHSKEKTRIAELRDYYNLQMDAIIYFEAC